VPLTECILSYISLISCFDYFILLLLLVAVRQYLTVYVTITISCIYNIMSYCTITVIAICRRFDSARIAAKLLT